LYQQGAIVDVVLLNAIATVAQVIADCVNAATGTADKATFLLISA
jgi:hypothetical protein